MEAYVDDMLVKSMEAGQHCKDLRETFELLRRYHMRLNPTKCVFGVSAGKFLGFMVTHRGIEANPDKIRALLEMEAPRTKKEIQRPESSGRMTRWSIELSEFDIQYQLRPAVKAQVLANFTAKRLPESSTKSEEWTLHVDGSSNAAGGGAGFILSDLEGNETLFALKLEFTATNNEAEYEALLAGLRLLVVEQLKGEFEARDPRMKKYLSKAREYIEAFVQFDIEHVPRAENKKADALAKLASATGSEWKDTIYLERIGKPSYEEDRINSVASVFSKDDWRASLFLYLQDGSLPEDNKEAQKVRRKVARYTLMGRELYRRSLTLPYLRCLS
ncbi:uncharacterized protein LOC131155865 [Malania oleifera]|uniref:uncharacterized protein LOC131155865 n=1 Tax=Malania oleifera TaxID=397392 RepID=UPI0025AEB666|nr:uncharacterized protein LOC131155865 [Malania oleifera]